MIWLELQKADCNCNPARPGRTRHFLLRGVTDEQRALLEEFIVLRFPAKFAALAVALMLGAVAPISAPGTPANPFFSPSTLPFGAPPFDRIKDSDYLPAFRAGIAQQRQEIEAIANNPAPPTFANTLIPLEKSGALLYRVSQAFSAVSQANTDDTLQDVQDTTAPELAELNDDIFLNGKLFARVKSVYDRRASLGLDPESLRLLTVDYQQFVLTGAQLDAADKAKMTDIDKRLSVLQSAFQRKLLAGTVAGALVVNSKSQLDGLSEDAIAGAAQTATAHHLPGKWMLSLQNTTRQPSLVSLNDRTTRQQLFDNSWNRTEKSDANDTRDTIATMAKLRAQRAQLLGYPNYAAFALTSQMAKTPEAVQQFLAQLIPPTRAKAEDEAKTIQAQIDASGQQFQLEPWDWEHYAEAVRKAKYNLDENEIRPYFEINHVLKDGLFYAANRLYGISFKERHDIPVYNPDVRVFEVYDKDGSPLALMYFDFFKRDNKSGGAWMATFVDQSKLFGTKPVVYNVENIPKGAPGQPTLLAVSSVTGMFHEFGHALNAFFADQKYASLAGASTARDFVEYPSQFNEHWALYPEVLKHYAVDYRTGKPMPQDLIDKIEQASHFNTGYDTGELLAADELDMAWHTLPASAPKQDVDAFEKKALASSGTDFTSVPPRYRSTYFAHIWGGGYAAGYYAYTWSEMLDDDTFQWFVDHGGLTRANGQRFRDMILSRGNSEDLSQLFRAFYGTDPQVGPLLQYRGLSSSSN
jgi:peptidyl-dipeptidase Dcp